MLKPILCRQLNSTEEEMNQPKENWKKKKKQLNHLGALLKKGTDFQLAKIALARNEEKMYSFTRQQILRAYYMPGTVLGARVIAVSKTGKNPYHSGGYTLVQRDRTSRIPKQNHFR